MPLWLITLFCCCYFVCNFLDIYFNDTDSELYTVRGMDAEISCIVIINPPQQVNVAWFSDNDDLTTMTNSEQDGEVHSSLFLSNISDEDKGSYSCLVNDGDTEYNVTTNLVVECKGIVVF